MIARNPQGTTLQPGSTRKLIGSLGHLVIFVWSLGTVLLTQTGNGFVLAGVCIVMLGIVYPSALRRILRPAG